MTEPVWAERGNMELELSRVPEMAREPPVRERVGRFMAAVVKLPPKVRVPLERERVPELVQLLLEMVTLELSEADIRPELDWRRPISSMPPLVARSEPVLVNVPLV